VQVEDSGSGGAVLVYGGDGGVRLAPGGNYVAWSLDDAEQFGETHLVIADIADVTVVD